MPRSADGAPVAERRSPSAFPTVEASMRPDPDPKVLIPEARRRAMAEVPPRRLRHLLGRLRPPSHLRQKFNRSLRASVRHPEDGLGPAGDGTDAREDGFLRHPWRMKCRRPVVPYL